MDTDGALLVALLYLLCEGSEFPRFVDGRRKILENCGGALGVKIAMKAVGKSDLPGFRGRAPSVVVLLTPKNL